MKKLILYILALMCLASCSSVYQFYQIGKLKSDNVILSNQGSYDYIDSNLKISYNFWSKGGNIAFTVTNISDKDIYLLTDRSFLIKNGKAYDYYKNRTIVNGSTNASAVAVYSIGYQNAQQQSVEICELKTICIPAKSYKEFSEYSMLSAPYRECGFARDSQEKEGSKWTFSSMSTSPLCIENRLVFNINGEIIPIVNTFYVVEFINILNAEGYLYVSDYSKDCNGKNVSWYPDVKFYRHSSPNCFYIPYDCTIGVDNDRINKKTTK